MNQNPSVKDTERYFFMRKAVTLTWIVFVFTMIVGLSGTFCNNLYRDNEFVKAVWKGNDIVTFAIASPLMIVAMLKGSYDPVKHILSFLLWMGSLWYMIYNYIFYIYGAAFNIFFLGYVVIITCSAIALLHGLIAIRKCVDDILPDRKLNVSFNGICLFLFIFAFLLGGAWIAMCLAFLFTGELPAAIIQTGSSTGVVFATDLIFLITPLVFLGYYLRKKQRWAILLTPIILVKCCLYPIVFVIAGILAYIETGAYDVLTPAYLLLGAGAALTLKKLFRIISN